MWDQRKLLIVSFVLARIIPTYVGSTPFPPLSIVPFSNHSHVCGINFSTVAPSGMSAESFPRMWDQLEGRPPLRFWLRIIPTYVGSTDRSVGRRKIRTNHSHVCGINDVQGLYEAIERESFPRMWDQQLRIVFLCKIHRIIPTYVGSTPCDPP